MKNPLFATMVLAITLSTLQRFAHAENRVGDKAFTLPTSTRMFANVPLSHWSYSALWKMASRFETRFNPQAVQRPISRYDFAIGIIRSEDQAGIRASTLASRDLFVALKYEYGMEIIGVFTSDKAGFDGYYSEADKKKFTEFALAAQKKHDTSSPDQWSDFLDEVQHSPLFAGN